MQNKKNNNQISHVRMRMRSFGTAIIAFLFMILMQSSLTAQITGNVVDATGEPLIGVTVVIQGQDGGTSTDVDGKYMIDASTGDVLTFSYVGFSDQLVTVGNQAIINVTMADNASILDEVIVTGYGTRKRSHNTGAIAQVDGSDVATIQANRVDDALAGKLAGVLIQNQDGAPGADPKIQIRAASSISGDSNPLIVVDGFPISGSLATVNPNDIQSMEVLKIRLQVNGPVRSKAILLMELSMFLKLIQRF